MALSPKVIRTQLNLLRPLLNSLSLKTLRKGQDRLGELMEARYREQVMVKEHPFPHFRSAWVIPTDQRRQGVILYLHGGGYACGGLDYALGFGSMLSQRTGTRVFCPAYRLAPENPFPAAVEDALESYRYLLDKGYPGNHITLCGESAGGGLCYALCLELKRLGLPMPCGIIAISPWTDLTASGSSYEENEALDPSMTRQQLAFYKECYTKEPENPLVSPLFGDLSHMPPSLLFVGSEEIMLDDAVLMHQQLLAVGCDSQLMVRQDRWHGYLLYGLSEDDGDFRAIEAFLNKHMAQARKLRWLRLDNAAKIYPAARRQNWSNVYRLSVTLKEPVDRAVLQSALDVTVRRFPSFAARLRRGLFWYYLEPLDRAPAVREEFSYPLTRMSRDEVRQCAFRVIHHKNRIALEIFHSLADGNGSLIFLKTLTAEYLQQKYGVRIPATHGVLGRLEEPREEELEDSFPKYAGTMQAGRRSRTAWQLTGTEEPDAFLHQTCFRIPVSAALQKAHSYGVTLTAFLCAVMMSAIQQLQKEKVPNPARRKPIKVMIPVNLRKLFPSKSLRNFAMYSVPELLPRLGEYSFEEICQVVQHHMGLEITPKHMGMMIATNVSSEDILAVRLLPLFLKNFVMRMVFDAVGEKKSCLSLSNLGAVDVPEEMKPYLSRFDFILGIQATAPYNCGVLSYGDNLYVNFIRSIREPELERRFHSVLQELGIPVQVQSNRGDRTV